jgi:hypothetical protein
MPGVLAFIMCMFALFLGLEAGAHGVLFHMIRAFVLISTSIHQGWAGQICQHLSNIGDPATMCPA